MEHIVQRTAGDLSQDKLYSRTQTVAQGNRIVAVSADMSGSMDGTEVRLALAAIAEATAMVGDEFLATCWREVNSSSGGYLQRDDSIGIGLVCDVDVPFQWEQLDAFHCSGGTPTADGIDITGQFIEDLHAREKILIVITDGKPNTAYSGDTHNASGNPLDDASQIVRSIRSQNIKVIGLYVGPDDVETAMAEIFGHDGFVAASMDTLAEKLIDIYRRQLQI